MRYLSDGSRGKPAQLRGLRFQEPHGTLNLRLFTDGGVVEARFVPRAEDSARISQGLQAHVTVANVLT